MHFLNLEKAFSIVKEIKNVEYSIVALQGNIYKVGCKNETEKIYDYNISIRKEDQKVIQMIMISSRNEMLVQLRDAYDKLDKLDHQYDETTDGF